MMKQGIQMRWSLMMRRVLVQCACGSDPVQFTPSRRAELGQLGIVARTATTAMTTMPRSPKAASRASVVRAPGVAGAFATAAAKSSAATMMRQASPLLGSNGDFEARAFVEQFVEPELARLNHEAALAKARESQAKRDAAKAQEVADEAKRLLALNTENHAKESRTRSRSSSALVLIPTGTCACT